MHEHTLPGEQSVPVVETELGVGDTWEWPRLKTSVYTHYKKWCGSDRAVHESRFWSQLKDIAFVACDSRKRIPEVGMVGVVRFGSHADCMRRFKETMRMGDSSMLEESCAAAVAGESPAAAAAGESPAAAAAAAAGAASISF